MKNVRLSLMAIAALVGITGAFAFKPHHATGSLVYAKQLPSSSTYVYQNTTWLASNVTCQAAPKEIACTFTSTATAAFFNNAANGYTTTPPLHNNPSPLVNYIQVDKAYLQNH